MTPFTQVGDCSICGVPQESAEHCFCGNIICQTCIDNGRVHKCPHCGEYLCEECFDSERCAGDEHICLACRTAEGEE